MYLCFCNGKENLTKLLPYVVFQYVRSIKNSPRIKISEQMIVTSSLPQAMN